MSLINIGQIDSAGLTLFVQQASSGSAFSGNLVSYVSASGFIGPTAVWTTGGAQIVLGAKAFASAISVVYTGGTGQTVARLYVDNSIASLSGAINTNVAVVSGIISSVSSSFSVTGSNLISSVNMTGIGGTKVIYSGGIVFISGGAGGAGSSNTSVTGSSAISAPNFTGAGSVVLTYDGTYVRVSGSASSADTLLSGYLENSFVHRGIVTESISGLKTFTGAVGVGAPTASGHAIPLSLLTGASGALLAQLAPGTVINTGTNLYIFTGITGNFVSMSFYFDEYNLTTGLNSFETFVARDFFFTGYALGVINTGTQGFFSGSFYQRTPINTKTNFVDFSLNSGTFFSGRGAFNQVVSGMNRVGLDIYRLGTGITGLTVGLFGVGY